MGPCPACSQVQPSVLEVWWGVDARRLRSGVRNSTVETQTSLATLIISAYRAASLSPFSIGFSIAGRLSNTSTLSCITLEGSGGRSLSPSRSLFLWETFSKLTSCLRGRVPSLLSPSTPTGPAAVPEQGRTQGAFPGLFPRICPNRNSIRVSWAKGKRTWGYERPNLSHSSPRLTSGAQALALPATPASGYWAR